MIIYLKTKEEVEGFRKAGKIAGEILQKVLNSVEVGITTQKLDEIAQEECRRLNVNPVFLGHEGFPAAICASNNYVMVHGIPNNQPIREGDILSIDMGVEIDGFIGDTADTIVVGDISSNQDKLALSKACSNALSKATAVAKEGNKLSDISTQIYKTAKSFGYSIPTEYGGHGIDKNSMHAAPFIPNIPDLENDVTLRAGMILAIEPMFIMGKDPKTKIENDGWGVSVNGLSAHSEHTVLVDFSKGIALTEREIY